MNLFNFKKSIIVFFIFLLISIALPIIWLQGDYVFMPEESSFANYQSIYNNNFYSWNDKLNSGEVSAQWNISLLFPNAIFYKTLGIIGLNNHIIQIIFLQIIILLTLLSISYFIRLFTNNYYINFLGSIFYIFNFYFLSSLAYTAKMYQLILLPLFFVLFLNFLRTRHYKYAVYNFLTLFFLQAIFTNLPQTISTLIIYPIVLIYFLYTNNDIKNRKFILSLIKDISLFFIILLPIIFYHGLIYKFAMLDNFNTIKNVSGFTAIGATINLIFQLRGAWWDGAAYNGIQYNHLANFYNNYFIILISYFLSFVSFICLLNKNDKINKFFLIFFLIFSFLASGTIICPSIYNFLYLHFPFFYIFREPWSKFMPLVLLPITTLFVLSLNYLNKLKINNYFKRLIFFIIFFGIIIRSLIFFSFDFFDHNNIGWKKMFIKLPDYWQEYILWSNEKKNYSVLPIPFMNESTNLEYVWYKKNTGNSNKPIYSLFGNTDIIGVSYSVSSLSILTPVLNLFNINNDNNFLKIVTADYLLEQKDINNNLVSESLTWQKEIKKYFNENPSFSFKNKLFLYRIKPIFYLPHFYTPQTLITTSQNIETLPSIVSQPDYNIRSAIYFNNINKNIPTDHQTTNTESIFNPIELQKETISNTPVIEFKKINPTKYRVIIHNAKENFPLIFSESFHNGWKSYLVNYNKSALNFNSSDYKIIDGNLDDQASTEELNNFINSGYISSLGNLKTKNIKHVKWKNNREVFDYRESYKIDFISKNFQDTIQNDNLKSGNIYETWFKKPVDNNLNHLMVNGYANAWTINPNSLCLDNVKCLKNANGSYDLELVIEFWPQRLFYIGLFISGTTLISCLFYLIYNSIKKRKNVL